MKKPKHPAKSSIPQFAANQKEKTYYYLDKDVAKLQGWKNEKHPNVLVSLRFVQHEQQCFSDWTKQQMKLFWAFQEKLSNHTWNMVYASGGKAGNKAGLGYTPINHEAYPDSAFKNQLSQDITLFELRVSQEMRVHGFRDGVIFYLCWLDKNHTYFSG